jgi:hypothetical protein
VLVAAVAAVAWSVADIVKHVLSGPRRRSRSARLVYGLVQDADGRWLVCIEGEGTAVDDGRGQAALDIAPGGRAQTPMLPPRG